LRPWGFGVATVDEGRELRAAGIDRPIVVFTPMLVEQLQEARAARLTPALHHAESIRYWAGTGLPWHLAVDTGMHRAGIRWDLVAGLRELLQAAPPEGAFTHRHSAELPGDSASRQLERFPPALGAMPARPPTVPPEARPAV